MFMLRDTHLGSNMSLAPGQRDWGIHTLSYASLFGFLPIQPVGNKAFGLVFYLERTHRLDEVDVGSD